MIAAAYSRLLGSFGPQDRGRRSLERPNRGRGSDYSPRRDHGLRLRDVRPSPRGRCGGMVAVAEECCSSERYVGIQRDGNQRRGYEDTGSHPHFGGDGEDTVMAGHAVKPRKQHRKAAVKKAAVKKAAVKKPAKNAAAENAATKTAATAEGVQGARIVVLTDDPHRRVVIVPSCHLDSMRQETNAYFFEDGNALVGMVVEGGTVEYEPADRTYIVRLTDGHHTGD